MPRQIPAQTFFVAFSYFFISHMESVDILSFFSNFFDAQSSRNYATKC